MSTISQVVTQAVKDIENNGYQSPEQINQWIQSILAVANKYTQQEIYEYLKRSLGTKYNRLISTGIKRDHQIALFKLEQIKPKLRAELDRRIMASAQLIKLDREAAIQKTIQRFSGWATSIPDGGSKSVETNQTKTHIKTPLEDLPFVERRVAIDQGHKLIANINDIVAVEAGAIAAIWHSHWRDATYNARHSHKERDGHIYVIPNNWALQQRLMKLDGHEYTTDITAPAEEVNCRCYYQYIYRVSELPESMRTLRFKQ